MTEDEVLAHVRAQIGSVSTLELLLLLKGSPKVWPTDDLVRELRSSALAVARAVDNLKAAGLISEHEGGYAFAPASAWHGELAAGIERIYLPRLAAFLLIIYAIVRKNMGAPRKPEA